MTEGTKSPHTGNGDVGQRCAASVEYKGRKGACRRDGKYPDPDGIRWWCGLHKPGRKAKKAEEEVEVVRTSASVSARPQASEKPKANRPKVTLQSAPSADGKVVDSDALVSASQAQVADSKAVEALKNARQALIEISNTNTVGWDATKPVGDYKVLIEHMSDRAREAGERLTEALRDLGY